MIRSALISDEHFDVTSRFQECVELHDWIAEDIAKRKVNLILLGGDLFERRSVPDDRNAAASWLVKLAELAPVVGVRGNHEVDGDLDLLNLLKSRHTIRFHDVPAVDHVAGVQIACLPWPRRSVLLASLGRAASPENVNAIANECLRDVLRGLGAEMDSSPTPRLFLGHVMMRGSRVAIGQPLAPGADFELGTEDLALVRAQAYLLGHIHMGQNFTVGGAPCFYPGSPRRTEFGESERKHYAIVEIDETTGAVSVEYVPTPAREMLLIEAAWTDDREFVITSNTFPHRHVLPNAEIRLRYTVASDAIDAARNAAAIAKAEWLEAGAHSVKPEEVVAVTSHARAPEIVTARTIADKLTVMWEKRGDMSDAERKTRLLGKLSELESGQ